MTTIEDMMEVVETRIFQKLASLGATETDLRNGDFYYQIIRPSKSPDFDHCVPANAFTTVFKGKFKQEEIVNFIYESMLPLVGALITEVAVSGAFVNFSFDVCYLAKALIGKFEGKMQFKYVKKEKVLIEFSSPNTNKPQHLGHIRNNVIGNTISKIYSFIGCDVTKINLINDRGIHICKSMLAYLKWSKRETPESTGKKGDLFVGEYYDLYEKNFDEEYNTWLQGKKGKSEYIKWSTAACGKNALVKLRKELAKQMEDLKEEEKAAFITKAIDDLFKNHYKEYYMNSLSPLEKEAQDMLMKWENNDPEVKELWKNMNQWVMVGFKETYKVLGVDFDLYQFESEMYEIGKNIVQNGNKNGIFENEDNGAIFIDLNKIGIKNEGKKILLKGNSSSVYMTQDIGVAMKRLEDFKPDKLVYVVANEQDKYFKILFKIIERLNPQKSGIFHHLSYGLVNLPSGRKTREGSVIEADSLILKMQNLAEKETRAKMERKDKKESKTRKELKFTEEEIKDQSLKIALAAIKFFLLTFKPETTMLFKKKESIQFKGKTGPYLLYTYARTKSIFSKCNLKPEDLIINENLFTKYGKEERILLNSIIMFQAEILRSALNYDTSKLTNCIYQICRQFSLYYKKNSIIHTEDEELKIGRLLIVKTVGDVLKTGLDLMGIETIDQM